MTGEVSIENQLSREEREILWYTVHRAARGLYCGGSAAMEALVARGMMERAGRKAFAPDPFYRITDRGRTALKAARWKA